MRLIGRRTGCRLRLLLVLSVALALAGWGCAIRRVTPYDPLRAVDTPPPVQEGGGPYDYDRTPMPVANHDVGSDRYHLEKVLTFPSIGENGQPGNVVTARYYRGLEPGARRLVIVLPVWGRPGIYPVRKMTRALRSRFRADVHLMVLESPNRIVDTELLRASRDVDEFRRNAARLAERCRATIVDVRRLIDWAEAQPEVDSGKIAVVGFSIGAVFAGNVALADSRVSAAVLVMGGTRPASILAHDAGRAAGAREEILGRFGWDRARYEDELQAVFGFLDAGRLAGGIDPRRVLMFEGKRDRRVPPSSRRALWEAMGRPELVTFPYRHRSSFMSMTALGLNWTTRRILDFLEETLATSRALERRATKTRAHHETRTAGVAPGIDSGGSGGED